MKTPHLLLLILVLALIGCRKGRHDVVLEPGKTCECPLGSNGLGEEVAGKEVRGALMATRFQSLEQFEQVVQVKYGASHVRLAHCSRGRKVTSVLEKGISEKDLKKAKDGGLWVRLGMVFRSAYAIVNRKDLQRVSTLARRRAVLFGEGDVAFYDLAEHSVWHIDPEDNAFAHAPDSSEKGYINTFNHMTAQAFITSIFSEDLADFVADVHERKNMPELISGEFTEEQMADPDNNPVDNYVDIINNEWGQEIGVELAEKYGIDRETHWTPELLANYLNDIQTYYSWAYGIGFSPFRPSDEVVVKFSRKLNMVMEGQVV